MLETPISLAVLQRGPVRPTPSTFMGPILRQEEAGVPGENLFLLK